MSSPDQQLTKKLAELKTFLERRIRQQEEEVNYLRSFVEVVDSLLAERSFKRVEIAGQTETEEKATTAQPTGGGGVPVMTVDGFRIGSVQIERSSMRVTPAPGVNLDSDSPPLRSFLLAKVLEPMQTKDREAAAAGKIPPDNILAYDVEQTEGHLKAINIQNYGDDRRLLELKNAIRWTLRRMYEKTTPKK